MLSVPQWSSREFPFSGRAGTPSSCALTAKVDPQSVMCDYEVYFCQVLLLVGHQFIMFIFRLTDFSCAVFSLTARPAINEDFHYQLIFLIINFVCSEIKRQQIHIPSQFPRAVGNLFTSPVAQRNLIYNNINLRKSS